MFHVFDRLWWGGNPDARNEVSGMSLRDVNHVQKSWKKIQKNSLENGMLMFVRLFHAQPETQLLFSSVAHLHSDGEIMENVMFRAHTVMVMSYLDNTIANLDKPEIDVVLMQKIGDTHRRLKAEKKHFRMFKECLVNILRNDLKFADYTVESWNRCLAFMYDHLLPRLSS